MAGLQMKYFVLNPKKKNMYGLASRMAMLAYAAIISNEDPKLCRDMRKWIDSLELEQFDSEIQEKMAKKSREKN